MADEHEPIPRGARVSRREQTPPWTMDADTREGASLHVVVRGSFHLQRHGAALPELELAPGDIVIVGAGDARSLRCVDPPASVDLTPAELLSAVYADAKLAADPRVLRLRAEDVRRARGLSIVVSLLRSALADPSDGQDRIARSLLEPLLAYVTHAREGGARTREPSDPRILRALARLRDRLADPWTVAALAKAAGLSRAAFARRFLADLGVPPLRYLAELRMDRAARLLVEEDASLAFIAAQIGYESEFAFSRAFKRHTGETPGAYRRRRRAERATLRTSCVRAAA